MPTLFDPLSIGDLHLPNRIVMAPLTRTRADDDHVPTPRIAAHYAQRASAGLIITEGVPVSRQGVGYQRVPGLWNHDQMKGWRTVTRAVHEAGGRIFAQLWHVGRVSHPMFNLGRTPVAPSAVPMQGHVSLVRPLQDYVMPRALTTLEIRGIVESFRQAAVLAVDAGFDGVELHAANGYLLDQFLQDGTNHRTDEYGGPVENRARLLLEVADAVTTAWGPGRVGVHLTPRGGVHQVSDSDPAATFGYVADQLGARKIAFLCLREHEGVDSIASQLKARFGGVVIANEGFTRESAMRAVAEGRADAVAFGSAYIANPDLVSRLRNDAPINAVRKEVIYAEGDLGYNDYPVLAETV